MSPSKYHIGTSGWVYPHWRGAFYPSELPQSRWFEHYSSHFSTVEINNSFYRLPSQKAFDRWRDNAPDGFIYTVKVSRFITHIKKLVDVSRPLSTFIDRARRLGVRLGPLLYQLPPVMRRDDARLESFLSLLPGDLHHTIEFRHDSWLHNEVFDMLRLHNVALCIFDMPGVHCPLAVTADFAYIRMHGSSGMYSSWYSDDELGHWAKKISELSRGLKSVYIYFNNDAEGFAVNNAKMLREKLTVL